MMIQIAKKSVIQQINDMAIRMLERGIKRNPQSFIPREKIILYYLLEIGNTKKAKEEYENLVNKTSLEEKAEYKEKINNLYELIQQKQEIGATH